jgi:crossover junction endodeoxyribonuclease RuvC
MRVLAFDLSSSVGWALFVGRRLVRSDTWRAPPESYDRFGRRFTGLYVFAREIIATQKPDVVAFESPAYVNRNPRNFRYLVGLASVLEMVAHMESIRCCEVNVSTAKKRLAGHGRADKTQMVVAAVRQGFVVANDHEADACAVALAALDHVGAP